MSVPETPPDIPRADTAVWTTYRAYLAEAVELGAAEVHVLHAFDEFYEYMRRPIDNYFNRMVDPTCALLPVWSCSGCGLHTMHQEWCELPEEPRI